MNLKGLKKRCLKEKVWYQKNSKKNTWSKKDVNEGGGQYFILKNGQVFDQVGVNFSKVQGKFPKNFRSKIPGANENPNYWASGISVVAHMKNPKVPAVHFNTRFITTSKSWFGGGMDVTPSFKDNREKAIDFFYNELKGAMIDLAKKIVIDGEGATKFITVRVKNAKDIYRARKICFSIANSILVKTAIAGEDANWCRIIMAIGKTQIKLETKKIKIYIQNFLLCKN